MAAWQSQPSRSTRWWRWTSKLFACRRAIRLIELNAPAGSPRQNIRRHADAWVSPPARRQLAPPRKRHVRAHRNAWFQHALTVLISRPAAELADWTPKPSKPVQRYGSTLVLSCCALRPGARMAREAYHGLLRCTRCTVTRCCVKGRDAYRAARSITAVRLCRQRTSAKYHARTRVVRLSASEVITR